MNMAQSLSRTVGIAAVALVAMVPTTADGQSLNMWTFKDLPYYEPLMAEPRAARMEVTIPAWAKQFPHSEETGTRFAWQVTLGREAPIIGVRSERVDGRVGKGEWGLGVWTPISFHMIEDFKDESAPIVDTDYRFGAMVKFQYGLKEDLWLGIKFVPWAHERTHLGDEYTIIALRQPDFERVNPSFEYQPGTASHSRRCSGPTACSSSHDTAE